MFFFFNTFYLLNVTTNVTWR